MAKNKKAAVKTPKKRSTKYGKLAAVCAKELSAKKAALVRAEKAFAKAQKTHTELLAEVARLDMLDRSLKALINGTEPPQNVRYVYSYPQWVWYGNPYGWYWNGYTWQVNLGQTAVQNAPYVYNGSFQGGQFTNTINTTVGDAPVVTTTAGSLPNSTTFTTSGSNCLNTVNSGSLIGYNSSGISLGDNFSLSNSNGSIPSAGPSTFTFTSGTSGQPELTVDLSTGATEDEPKAEAKSDEKVEDKALPVGYGG